MDAERDDTLSEDRYDQQAELGAMNAPGALERIEERQKGIAERLTPKGETAPSDVPYVTWIPSEDRAGLGMRMGIRMVEYRALVEGLPTRYMRVQYDEKRRDAAVLAYQMADRAALEEYRRIQAAILPSPPPAPPLIPRLFIALGMMSARKARPVAPPEAAYEALKAARRENRVRWDSALRAAVVGVSNAGEPDIQSVDPQTYFYKLMTSHKGMRAAQLVELGKMGRTEKKPQRRGFFGFGARQ